MRAMIGLLFFFALFVSCGKAFDPLPASGKLATLLARAQSGDLDRALELLNDISSSDFKASQIEQWQRARIPISNIFSDADEDAAFPVTVRVLTIPRSSSMVYSYSQLETGHVLSKVLSGDFRLRTYSVQSADVKPRYTASVDGFAVNAEEDCVCRGGICPRRFGCRFWVERMASEQQLCFNAVVQTDHQTYRPSGSDLKQTIGGIGFTGAIGGAMRVNAACPVEVETFSSADSDSAVILEVLVGAKKSRDFAARAKQILYYEKDVVKGEKEKDGKGEKQCILKASQRPPLGYATLGTSFARVAADT
jgi:hypothetical protein